MEIWQDIPEYEGLYQVSNTGKIRSLDRISRHNCRSFRSIKGRILKPFPVQGGYLAVYLCRDGIKRSFKVHRLVAFAFCPNPQKEVNHKDGNRQNNNVSNLEWCSRSENNRHSYAILGRKSPNLGKINNLSPLSKRVKQISLDGKILKIWDSTMAIERALKYSSANIAACCRLKFRTMYGYIWRYDNSNKNKL
ncbi:NUMOD4 domain-containing protein [uncultured Alistipes sp.]|jgi:hypothetical protein|uniref:NUMOD4 domain-containing protein n=1 Tax=uncultured Alistipes sp. TaxID=538949 RepID=UPI0025D3EBA9|nr:NUMOD4 domain-containing protein [uncultured Alistipes sp.]